MKESDKLLTGRIYATKHQKQLKNIYTFFMSISFFIFLSTLIFNATFTSAQVHGLSMYPTVNEQFYYNEQCKDVVYYTAPYNLDYCDIIIVDLPGNEQDGIKRLVAKGGDKICFGDIYDDNEYLIYLNDTVLLEPYLTSPSINKNPVNNFKKLIRDCLGGDTRYLQIDWLSQNNSGQWQITLPNDYCIYLGDNRSISLDCSIFGPQHISTIIGKVEIVVPYGLTIYNYWWYQFCQLFK